MDTDILMISSDEQLCQLIQVELGLEGYSVLTETDGTAGLITARKTQPRLLILDRSVSSLSAVEICNRLQATAIDLKIVLLIEGDQGLSIDVLVDDFLFMPLSLTELLLRVQRNLRPQPSRSSGVLRFETLSLSLETREVYRAQRLIELTPKEFDLLTYLLQNSHQVVTRDQLLEKVWDYDFNGTHNVLHVCIRSLRNKLEAAGESRLIQTVRGVGYILKTLSSDFSDFQASSLANLHR
jgi:DNA-binding response OmpR family regulator